MAQQISSRAPDHTGTGDAPLQYARLARLVAKLFYSSPGASTVFGRQGGDGMGGGKGTGGGSGDGTGGGSGDKGGGGNSSLLAQARAQGLPGLLLAALTRHEWVKEDVVAKHLGLTWRQTRRALNDLERDLLITRVVLRDSKAAASGAPSVGLPAPRKESALSYCCLDYKRMVDVCRLRLHKMRRRLKAELEEKATIEDYCCADEECAKTYSALEVLNLDVDPTTFDFLCEDCEGPLQQAGGSLKNADARRKHREAVRAQLDLLERQLAPLTGLLRSLEGVSPPFFGTLHAWAQLQEQIRRARKDGTLTQIGGNDDAQEAGEVVIAFEEEDEEEGGAMGGGTGNGGGAGGGAGKGPGGKRPAAPPKELPPWMRLGFTEPDGGANAGGSAGESAGKRKVVEMGSSDPSLGNGAKRLRLAGQGEGGGGGGGEGMTPAGKRVKEEPGVKVKEEDRHGEGEGKGEGKGEGEGGEAAHALGNDAGDDGDDDVEWEDA